MTPITAHVGQDGLVEITELGPCDLRGSSTTARRRASRSSVARVLAVAKAYEAATRWADRMPDI